MPLLSFIVGMRAAQPQDLQTALSTAKQSTAQNSVILNTRELDHTQWPLTDAEWTRYDQIMRGPRGITNPSLDPITALAVEARSDEEREHFANLLVEQERTRAGKELALVRAYAAAWIRNHGNEPMFDKTRLGGGASPAPATPFQLGDSISFFTTTDCEPCVGAIKAIAKHVGNGQFYPTLDIYFLDGDDTALTKWAARSAIPERLFGAGITLNRDNGLLAKLQKVKSPSAPMAYRRRDDEFTPIQMDALFNDQLYPSAPKPTGFVSDLIDKIKGTVP